MLQGRGLLKCCASITIKDRGVMGWLTICPTLIMQNRSWTKQEDMFHVCWQNWGIQEAQEEKWETFSSEKRESSTSLSFFPALLSLPDQLPTSFSLSSHSSVDLLAGVNKLWPMGQIQPVIWLCKQSFIGTQPCPFVSSFSMPAFVLQWQSWIVATETLWPAKPQIFTTWPFTGKRLPTPALQNKTTQA